MKLKRRFYDASVNFSNISIKRLVLGILIGLACAFTIYSFFYVLSESFRIMSFGLVHYGFQNTQDIISETDRNFYNLFFAGLSLILGNSITILYIFSKPDRIINRLNPKRKRILNDQIFLSFNFSYWFNKIGLAFGVFAMCCMDFEYIPYFKSIAYLLLIVLYLESWKNLSLIIKKNRIKIQLIHLLTLLILTVGLSKIDVVDYKSLDQLSLKYNPIIDLPNSDFYNNPDLRNRFEISFKLQLNEKNDLDIFTEDLKKISINELTGYIFNERADRGEYVRPYLKARILADKNINIKYVKMFEAELYAINQHNIIYEVYNDDLFKSKFENGSINKRNSKSILKYRLYPNKNYETFVHPPRPEPRRESSYRDTLKITINNQIKINGLPISNTHLVKNFKNNINKETLFLYRFNPDTTYENYITVLSSHYKAAYELREKEQTIFIENRYYNPSKAYRNEQNKLKLQFPILECLPLM